MSVISTDPEREERIDSHIIVDAYTPEEVALGWYYYLDRYLNFPFQAEWNRKKIEVVSMSSEEHCSQEMFVEIRYREEEVEDIFSVPLNDIDPLDVDEPTEIAVADWNYWVGRGYEFGEI